MKLIPTQDWMILKLVERETNLAIPDIALLTSQQDYMGYEVLAIGPWDAIYEYGVQIMYHQVNVGDIVVIEGLNAPVFEFDGEKYVAARARHVCFKKGATE